MPVAAVSCSLTNPGRVCPLGQEKTIHGGLMCHHRPTLAMLTTALLSMADRAGQERVLLAIEADGSPKLLLNAADGSPLFREPAQPSRR